MLDPSYIRSIRDGIINGNIEANNQEGLPDGLVGLYDKELFPPTMKWKERKETLDFFLVFALAQKEISADFAAEILGDEWYNQADEQTSKEEKRLKKVNDLVQLHSKRLSSAEGGKYRLYHERFRVFVLQKVSEEDIDQFNAKFISLCETALETISEKNIPEKESYALEFISTHYFISAMQGVKECLNKEQAAALKKYAYDQQFWERQVKASKGFEWSKKMLGEMMSWASKFDDEEVIECALNKVDLYHQEQNDAPRIVQLVADGDIETVLARIEKFGGEDKDGMQRQFILYMLCLMELTLLDSKEKDHAKSSIEKILKHLDENIPANQPDLIDWNDFFPSYLMFLMVSEWAEFGIDYLVVYMRIDELDSNWIEVKAPYSELQFRLLMELVNLFNGDELLKSQILRLFAIELAHEGKINQALDLLDEISYDHERSIFYSTISLFLAKEGKIQEAYQFADLITDDLEKSKALASISIEMTKQGNYRDALKNINSLEFKKIKLSALSAISFELFKKGNYSESKLLMNEAIQETSKISDKFMKSELLRQLSNDLYLQGEQAESNLLMQEAIELALMFRDNEEYLNDGFQIDLRQDISEVLMGNILRLVLVDNIYQDNLSQALVCVNHLGQKFFNSRTLNEFFVLLEKQGISRNNYIVKAVLAEIYSLKNKTDEFCSVILASQFKFGETIEYLNSIANKSKSGSLLKEVSIFYINEGYISESFVIYINHIGVERGDANKHRILNDIASSIFLQGKDNEAMKLIDFLEIKQKEISIKNFSEEFIKLGKFSEAKNCILVLQDSNLKVKILKSISSELYKKGRRHEANIVLKEAVIFSRQISSIILRFGAQKVLFNELLVQGMKDQASSFLQELLIDTKLIDNLSERLKLMIEFSSMFLEINEFVNYETLIHEIIKITGDIGDNDSRSKVLFDIASELKKQNRIEFSKLILKEAIVCVDEIEDNTEKEFALGYMYCQMVKCGQFEVELNDLHSLIIPSMVDLLLYELSIEFLGQGLFSKAIECLEFIKSSYWKNASLTRVSDYLYMNGKIQEALIYTNQNKDLREKSTSLSRIAVEFLKKGDLVLSIHIAQGISAINIRQKCWQTIGQVYEKHNGIFKSLRNSKQFHNTEAKAHYLKGVANSLGIFNCNKEVVFSSLIHCHNDIESSETLLQKHFLHILFFEDDSSIKLDRYNRTLNLQWAIDIKNQLPN